MRNHSGPFHPVDRPLAVALFCGLSACYANADGGANSDAASDSSRPSHDAGGRSAIEDASAESAAGGAAGSSDGAGGGSNGGALAGGGALGSGGFAGSTTGTGGGGMGPGGGDAGRANPCAGRLVCDDFEGGTVGKQPGAPWAIHSAKGTAVVDTTRAFSGTHSVKVHIDATTSSDTYRQAMLAVTGAPLIPLPNNTVYGRFMIYTDRIPGSSVHWTIAHGDGPLANENATYNYGGMGGLMANYYRNTSPTVTDCWQTKTQTFPTKNWVCVGFVFDGGANEMRFSLDGTEVPELHVVGLSKTDATCTKQGIDGRWQAPKFSNVAVGWESYQDDTTGAHDAWIDDVILDTKAIPCP